MSNTITAEARAATGRTYVDKTTGQERKSYIKVGVEFTNDNGSRTLMLEALPVNFDGRIYLVSPRAAKPPETPAGLAPSHVDDDVPF